MKEEEKVAKNHQKMNMVASKLYSSQLRNSEIESEETRGIVVRKSEIGVAREQVNEFRRNNVNQNQKRSLEKRTDLIIQQAKPKTDFKMKIEALLEQKLTIDPSLRSPEK